MSEPKTAEFEWFRAYVGQCLAEQFDGSVPPIDDDDDWVIGWDSSVIYVSAHEGSPWCADAWAIAVRGLRPRVAVLREINDLNLRMPTAKAALSGGALMIRQRVLADGLNAETINQAVMSVGIAAEHVGVMMASMFDGYDPFAVEVSSEDAG